MLLVIFRVLRDFQKAGLTVSSGEAEEATLEGIEEEEEEEDYDASAHID